MAVFYKQQITGEGSPQGVITGKVGVSEYTDTLTGLKYEPLGGVNWQLIDLSTIDPTQNNKIDSNEQTLQDKADLINGTVTPSQLDTTDDLNTDDSNILASAKSVNDLNSKYNGANIDIGTIDPENDTTFPTGVSVLKGYGYISISSGTIQGEEFGIDDILRAMTDNPSDIDFNDWRVEKSVAYVDFTDTTWVDLVANASKEAGQKYNITTANPDDGIIYGKIILITENKFDYLHTSGTLDGIIETVIID